MKQKTKNLFDEFADFVVASRDAAIKRWSRAIYEESNIKAINNLTHQQLVQPLDRLVDGIAELLRNEADFSSRISDWRHGYQHSSTRFQQGYTIDDLLHELGLLRIILVDFINEFAVKKGSADVGLVSVTSSHLHKLLNEIFFASIRQFYHEQRSAAERYRRQLEQSNAQLGQVIRELTESEERFRSTFEQAAIGIAHIAWDGRWLRANKKLCEIIGYSADELTQRTLQDITHPEDFDANQQLFRRLQAGEFKTYTTEKRYVKKDGTAVWVNLTVSKAQTVNGAPGYAIKFVEDITARKMLERELQDKVSEAENANRAKDEIISIVSHELRTPLNAALGWSQLLTSGRLDQASAEHAMKVIERNIKMQERLVNDLLDVGRIITGKMTLDIGRVEIIPLVESSLETVGPMAEEKRIKIERALDQGVQPITGDPHRLQQVLLNLLTNAVKFTPEGGKISLTLVQRDNDIELKITDNGKGISADFLPYVFDRFRQDVSGWKGKKGLGLGLPIARYIIELHGGSITAASEGEGQGATFTIRLPRSPAPVQAQ